MEGIFPFMGGRPRMGGKAMEDSLFNREARQGRSQVEIPVRAPHHMARQGTVHPIEKPLGDHILLA